MEIAAKNETIVSFKNASLLEKEGELTKALSMYEKLLKKSPSDIKVLSRLMIICRKLKSYSKELGYINQAIKVYEEKFTSLKSKDVKVVSLSRKLNSLLAHTDKKGKNLLAIPEVEQLKKRREVVLKRRK